MSFSSYFRKKLSNAVKIQDNSNFIEKYRQINCMGKDQFPYVNIRSPAIRAFRTSQGDSETTIPPRAVIVPTVTRSIMMSTGSNDESSIESETYDTNLRTTPVAAAINNVCPTPRCA